MNTPNDQANADDFEALYLAYKAKYESVQKDAERYRWLRERLFAADFDYGYTGCAVIVFSLPKNCGVSANCDLTIDNAMLVHNYGR